MQEKKRKQHLFLCSPNYIVVLNSCAFAFTSDSATEERKGRQMASWLAKAIVQRGIGALPNPHYWNELIQNRMTHSLNVTKERFEASLRNCRNLEQLQRFGSPATGSGFSVFELGTSWFPTVPIGFFLCVAREVWIWDIVPFLRRDRLKHTLRRFLELDQEQGVGRSLSGPAQAALSVARGVGTL